MIFSDRGDYANVATGGPFIRLQKIEDSADESGDSKTSSERQAPKSERRKSQASSSLAKLLNFGSPTKDEEKK